MSEHLLVGLATVIVLGIGAQWIAWRLNLPGILLLLIAGFLAGPVTGFFNPNEVFGDLLLPLVSVSVGIILFEGGLSLKFSEFREIRKAVVNLVTIGVLVTWVLSTAAAYYLFDLDFRLALLLGAVLVVTGPTVIIPLLRHVRPSGKSGSIMKWEGIVIDPIGAMLAVLVFEAIISASVAQASEQVVLSVIKAAVIGGVSGLLGAKFIMIVLRRYWVPDFLQNPMALMIVVLAFTVSDYFQSESGLLAVTVMGIVLANQKSVSVKHIIEFKETLRVLFISSLFIILAARLTPEEVQYLMQFNSIIFLLLMIFIIRPLCVFFSTISTGLNVKEKVFLSWMAPRGIVAAAVSSVFALRLAEAGFVGAERLVDITFLVITATVTVYGLTASPLARYLGIASPNPQGVLFVGAHDWARAIAKMLQDSGYHVSLVDSNWANISAARNDGLKSYYENILLEDISEDVDLNSTGKLVALTSNEEVNSLSALHFVELFGRSQVYQLAKHSKFSARSEASIPQHLRGRLLFSSEATYDHLTERFTSGAVIKKFTMTEDFNYESFKSLYENALPMFIIKESGELVVCTSETKPAPTKGQHLIALVDELVQ